MLATGDTMKITAALLSRHQKARLLRPALQNLGWQLCEVDSFDTDSLGSFAGEHPRFMSPNECALRKAAIAADLSGCDLGIGSEGSFSAGPYGIGTFNLELISCVNISAGWAVTGRFYGPSSAQQWQIRDSAALEQALAGIPDGQKLLLQQATFVSKGLSVEQARQQALAWLAKDRITLSFDLRAHCCPERQEHIRQAAADLVQRIKRICPQCHTPGFWPDQAIKGLPCADCGAPSSLTKARQACCQRCGYAETFAADEQYASAQYCQVCNP